MLGTKVNALIAFLRWEALALTKDSSFPMNLSIFQKKKRVKRPGVALGYANAQPPGHDKICECPTPPCIRRLSPQYVRQSKFSCPIEMTQK